MGQPSVIVFSADDVDKVPMLADDNVFTGSNSFAGATVLNGALTGTSVKDEDTMTSDSATAVPTQQSVKAYVDGVGTTASGALTTHESDTSTHGVTTVAGLAEAQIFTNKKFGDDTNYTTFAADGEMIQAGTARAWKSWDVRPDAVKLPGSNPPAADTIDAFPFLRFDRGTEESVYYLWEVPSDFATGDGSVKGRFEFVVFNPPTSGGTNTAENVRMGFEYKKLSDGNVFDFTAGTSSGYLDEEIAVDEAAEIIHTTVDGTCTTTGWAVGDTILFRFYRDATAAEDTYDNEASAADNDVWVFDFHMQYLINKLGAAS